MKASTFGKYPIKAKTRQARECRCVGCGALCANTQSLLDHEFFCDAAKNRHEYMRSRGLDGVIQI